MNLLRKVDSEKYTDEMPEYPAQIILKHMFNKGIQTGSVLGLFVVLPTAMVIRKNIPSFVWAQSQPQKIVSTTLGTVTAVCMGIPFTMGLTEEGVDDRAYRLVQNANQNRVDTYSLIGLGAGITAGYFTKQSPFIFGATGVVAGIGYHLLLLQLQPSLGEKLKRQESE